MLTENLTFCEFLINFLKLCYEANSLAHEPLKTLIMKMPAEFKILSLGNNTIYCWYFKSKRLIMLIFIVFNSFINI